MNTHTYKISLTLRAPVLVQSTTASALGIDAAVARVAHGPHEDAPCIPFTLLKGKLREAAGNLLTIDSSFTSDSFDRLFGKAPGGRLYQPFEDSDRGRLIGEDLVAENPVSHRRISRTAVDSDAGAASDGSLRVLEAPYAPGETVTFTGTLFVFLPSTEDSNILKHLQKIARLLCQIGSHRTTGLGEILETSVEKITMASSPKNCEEPPKKPSAIDLSLRPRSPFCITRPRPERSNFFESESFLPGNVIAGALAETWTALSGKPQPASAAKNSNDPHFFVGRYFDRLRFRHAFPSRSPHHRHGTLPLSVARTTAGLTDLAEKAAPCLLRDSSGEWVSPAFSTDWKSFDDAEAPYGIVHPAREMRVRTAMNPATRTADQGTGSEGGSLFGLEVAHPFDDENEPLHWVSRVDFPEGLEDSITVKLADQLGELLRILGFVGKTKTVCEGEVRPAKSLVAPALKEGETLRLQLQTPALLADPRFQNLSEVPSHGTLTRPQMRKAYEAAWSEISGNSLSLLHAWADQSLAGGNTLAHRFRKGKPYNPWLLTSPGSVFFFRVTDPTKANHKLQGWLNHGISLPHWAVNEFGTDWRENPYRPENGFGEIFLHDYRHPSSELLDCDCCHDG